MIKFLKQVKYFILLKLFIILELHEEEIIKLKVSQTRNILYTLDRLGNVKVTDFFKAQIKNIVKLELGLETEFFDVDRKEKFILFNKGPKIQLYSLDNGNTITLGSHSSKIKNLHFSDDGQFIVSSTNKDYSVFVWNKKAKDTPLFILQTTFIPTLIKINQIEKGIYHSFVCNKSKLQGFKLIVDELTPNHPVNFNFEIEFVEKNLLNIDFINNGSNSAFSLVALIGNPYNLVTKQIKYANNSKNFKNINSKISINNSNNEDDSKDKIKSKAGNATHVLNDIEMNTEYTKTDLENNDLAKSFRNLNNDGKVSLKGGDKISLVNIINNSIINNDNKNFEWALNQKVTLSLIL